MRDIGNVDDMCLLVNYHSIYGQNTFGWSMHEPTRSIRMQQHIIIVCLPVLHGPAVGSSATPGGMEYFVQQGCLFFYP